MNEPKVGLGILRIPLVGASFFTVTGGPFRRCPSTYCGVKMAAEVDHPHEISIPTRDYCVPDLQDLRRGLQEAVAAMLQGKALYVGCMGGMGRTGLFMAVLCKAFGIKNPVEYVRANYYSHAVETPEQYEFVQSFAVLPKVRWMIKWARIKNWNNAWGGYQSLTKIPASSPLPVTQLDVPGAFGTRELYAAHDFVGDVVPFYLTNVRNQ